MNIKEVQTELFNLLLQYKIITTRGSIYLRSKTWQKLYPQFYITYKDLCDTWFTYFQTEDEAWYCLNHQTLPEEHKCIICGKNALYHKNKAIEGYLDYCSQECRIIGQRKKLEDTCFNKYGEKTPSKIIEFKEKSKQTCKNKYGVEYVGQVEEFKEKSKETCINKYGVEYSFQSDNNKEKSKQTCKEKYGVDNYVKTEEFKEKSKQTCINKYNVDNYAKTIECKEKIKQTCINKYGVNYYSQTKEFKEKSKQTCKEKYGVDNFFELDDCRKKAKDSLINKYGVNTYFATEDSREKIKQVLLNKYGVDNYAKTEEYKEKYKQTCQNRYGIDNYAKTKESKDKSIQTCIEKYGVPYPSQNPIIHHKQLSHKGMSSPEQKLNDFLNNRGFDYKYEYDCNGKNFDFAIFKNNELSILVEVDGEYFHGLLSDYDMYNVHGQNDCERFNKVPEGVKFIVCDGLNIEKCFDEILKVFNLNYEEWIQDIIKELPKEFPYPQYSENRLKKDYSNLCKYSDIKKTGRLADSTIRQFHKSLWSAHRSNLPSPLEAWNNKELLEKCVKNRFIYSSNLSSQSIVNGFNVCKIAPKVSVFSASLAKYLICKYLNEYDIIFDPFSGFSGRMLGTCACNKHYIGQDINEEHINESKEIINFHNLNAEVSVQNILTDTNSSYDCLFTCSPYGGIEHWNVLNDKVEKSCDEWIDICLDKYKCSKYLFVVNQTEKYKDYIVEEINNKSHLGEKKEYIICL